jgi:hypothetical protein
MGKESPLEQDDQVNQPDRPTKVSSWRSALVIDLAGRIRVTRRRALAGTLERRPLDQEPMPAAGGTTAEWSTRFPS